LLFNSIQINIKNSRLSTGFVEVLFSGRLVAAFLQVKVMNQPIQTLSTQYCSAEQQQQLELSGAEWEEDLSNPCQS